MSIDSAVKACYNNSISKARPQDPRIKRLMKKFVGGNLINKNATMAEVCEAHKHACKLPYRSKYHEKMLRVLPQVLESVKNRKVAELTEADWMDLAAVAHDLDTWQKPTLQALSGFVKTCQSLDLVEYIFFDYFTAHLLRISISKPSPEKAARMKTNHIFPDGMSLILRSSLKDVPKLVFEYDSGDYLNMDSDTICQMLEHDFLKEIQLTGYTARNYLDELRETVRYPLPENTTSFQRLAIAMSQSENLKGVSREMKVALIDVAFSERYCRFELCSIQAETACDVLRELVSCYQRHSGYLDFPKKLTQAAATEAYWFLRLFLDVAVALEWHAQNVFAERELENFNTVKGVRIWHNLPGAVF